MKMQSFFRGGFPGVIVLLTLFALAAFTGGPRQHAVIAKHSADTIPSQKRNKITRESGDRDFDKELRQLDEAQQQLDKLKDKDWDKIQNDIEESLRKIDVEKIQQQVTDAYAKVDFENINRQIQESLRKIDFEKMKLELDKSLENAGKIDKEEIKKEIQKAERQVKEALDREEWKEELKNAQKLKKEELEKEMARVKKDMEKVKEDMKKEKFNFKKEMEKAKIDLDKSKEELKGYQEMIYDMEKEGLLSTKDDYSIEYKDGNLYINDKKQSQQVTDKYKKYFKKNKIAIKKQDGDINIRHHNSSDTHID
jgi:hypothetical protein